MKVEKLYFSGYTATPPRREISKTAIGAEEWIDWEYEEDPVKVITDRKSENFTIVGLEITSDSIPITDYRPPSKICLVIGHEVTGIPEDLLNLCDDVVHIPMHGKKESLNVSVAAGIALDRLRN